MSFVQKAIQLLEQNNYCDGNQKEEISEVFLKMRKYDDTPDKKKTDFMINKQRAVCIRDEENKVGEKKVKEKNDETNYKETNDEEKNNELKNDKKENDEEEKGQGEKSEDSGEDCERNIENNENTKDWEGGFGEVEYGEFAKNKMLTNKLKENLYKSRLKERRAEKALKTRLDDDSENPNFKMGFSNNSIESFDFRRDSMKSIFFPNSRNPDDEILPPVLKINSTNIFFDDGILSPILKNDSTDNFFDHRILPPDIKINSANNFFDDEILSPILKDFTFDDEMLSELGCNKYCKDINKCWTVVNNNFMPIFPVFKSLSFFGVEEKDDDLVTENERENSESFRMRKEKMREDMETEKWKRKGREREKKEKSERQKKMEVQKLTEGEFGQKEKNKKGIENKVNLDNFNVKRKMKTVKMKDSEKNKKMVYRTKNDGDFEIQFDLPYYQLLDFCYVESSRKDEKVEVLPCFVNPKSGFQTSSVPTYSNNDSGKWGLKSGKTESFPSVQSYIESRYKFGWRQMGSCYNIDQLKKKEEIMKKGPMGQKVSFKT